VIDLVDKAADYLRAKGYKDASVRRLESLIGREGIVVRRLPTIPTGTYQDRTRSLDYLYQVVVRRGSERQAMEECSDIAELLCNTTLMSGNGSYRMSAQDIYTEPQELPLEDTGFYAWEVRICASITIGDHNEQ